jgi:hypothetical protein
MKRIIIAAAFAALASPAFAFDVGIVAFQMSSETHARVANAAKDAATAKGWKVQILNSEGSLPRPTARPSSWSATTWPRWSPSPAVSRSSRVGGR